MSDVIAEGTIDNPIVGSITYFERKWLFPIEKIDNSFISVKVDQDHYFSYADLTISDGSNQSELYFSYDDPNGLAKSTGALDTMIEVLTNLKTKMIEDYRQNEATWKKVHEDKDND